MGKKLGAPQWLKDALASYRAMRAVGDLSPSEMREHLADDIQARHETGDPFGRAVWVEFIDRLDRDVSNKQHENADEAMALELASGFIQPDLFPAEALAELGLPPELDLGGYGKRVVTPDARYADVEKYLAELRRKRKSWDESLDERIEAAERTLAILPSDNSRTLREVIADPEEYGHGSAAAL
jgi:hypothetical protein